MTPKEDPKDKADRLRERRISLLERMNSTEESAKGLTSDLRAVYGLTGIKPMPTSPAIEKPITGKSRTLPSMFGTGR